MTEGTKTIMEINTKLLKTIDRVPGVRSFRFERPSEANFTAGQYFILTIPVNGKPAVKAFSFSSSPTEKDYIEFTKRFTDSDYSQALKALKPGDSVSIRMPMGKFTLDESKCDKLAFLSGGIGVTPFRSICKYVVDTGTCKDIVMLDGNNDEDSIVFKDDFDQMNGSNENLKIVYTVTSPEAVAAGCSCGRTGFIDSCMITEEIPDYTERTFYVCGPPPMVEALTNTLKDCLNIPEDRIVLEHFQGY